MRSCAETLSSWAVRCQTNYRTEMRLTEPCKHKGAHWLYFLNLTPSTSELSHSHCFKLRWQGLDTSSFHRAIVGKLLCGHISERVYLTVWSAESFQILLSLLHWHKCTNEYFTSNWMLTWWEKYRRHNIVHQHVRPQIPTVQTSPES